MVLVLGSRMVLVIVVPDPKEFSPELGTCQAISNLGTGQGAARAGAQHRRVHPAQADNQALASLLQLPHRVE